MKKLFIVANWKSNNTSHEAKEWLSQIESRIKSQESRKSVKEIIVCPSFSLLSLVKSFVVENKLPIKVGSQDFSAFTPGAHTGEEPPNLLQEFIEYAIIGHSERRDDLGETDELLAKKAANALKYDIQPVFCVQGVETPIPKGISIVAYEPVFAIGTGNPDTPENAQSVIKKIKAKSHVSFVLYGGSVMGNNVHNFTKMPSIDGVLVGGASLDAEKFFQIIKNA